jgi:polyisoprenoid-binding protein YceI
MTSTLVRLALAGVTAVGAPTWHVARAEVRVVCPMTIGGSFEARTTALTGSVAAGASGSRAFDGTLAVDLRTLDTGIGLRNEHLREKYLEVDKEPGFETARLSQIELDADDPDMPEGKAAFTGRLTLHGVSRQVTGVAEVRRTGDGLRVTASFPVDLREFGIRKPRYLGIGVKDVVQVEVAVAVAG